MRIKRLRLTGFKSFVDPAELHIEPGLTGVVGPNGCGKSNLLEALRWVMGETSAKSLRGAGMEDVIFAGTQARPARDFAEVSVLADGVEGDDVLEVVRRIERGAGSAYRINGRDVRAKDVALAFADAATGAHSPALVSQGRIGAIIAAKPAERRAMLEEAAGIAGLHVRRRDAEAKLRATEANLERIATLIGDQEARAAALRRQARQAERYRTLSAAIQVAEARMIFARWRDAAAASDAAQVEAQAAEATVATRAEAHAAAIAAQDGATAALADARSIAATAREAASAAGHQVAALRSEAVAAARRLAELGQQVRRVAEDRAREGTLAQDAAAALQRLAAEAGALQAQITGEGERMPALAATLANAEAAARDAEVALAQALTAQAGELADARVAAAAVSAARARADRLAVDRATLAREEAAAGDAAPLEAARQAAAAAADKARSEAVDARAALEQARSGEAGASGARDGAQSARAAAHAELAAIDSEARALARSTAPSGKDRLLERVRPDPGYERALAAALGDELEAGLDSMADRHWAGAAIDAGDPPPPAGTIPLAAHVQAPAVLGRRLVQVFVVEQDDGVALAAGQRLVTTCGVLRRWDGFRARGSGAAAAERLERVNRQAALAAARPTAAAAVADADAALADLDARITAARRAAAAAEQALQAAETAVREALRAEDRAAAQLERLAGLRRDLAVRRARIDAELAQAAAELEAATAAAAALPDGDATGRRVAEFSHAADAARARVATLRAERLALERTLAAARERAAGAAAEAKGWRARAGEAARRITDLDAREAVLAAETAALAGRPAALAATIESAEAEARTLRRTADEAAGGEQAAEQTLRQAEATGRATAEALATAREARAGAVARAEAGEARRIEMGRLSGERFQCPPTLLPERAGFAAEEVGVPAAESSRHERLMADRERIGPVNLVAEAELAALEASASTLAADRDELVQAVHRLRGSIGALNREGRERLAAAFAAVDEHFRRLFGTLFNGGQAHLALVDSDDPLEAGLEIMAQPPGKRLQSLTLLSGGEQALTAVALIFALFLTAPAPICVLDEVDAPLDDANIDRFCDLLDRMVAETATRYLIVTHNAATMSRMHRLFGVTMIEQGVSRLVSVDLGGADRLRAAE
ncbi:condensin subunit Smc [Sphingomonas guangdongensis]|uniref:Chromosome partition protein Smc n=1 Tax=Sphingomonas guangdongensis TaxID=1141890 RepID=A0A285QHI4_9SPHN|nr:AAA family ATPase [Sphingomonas guangdongensis]SOB80968.1 condensin subunit Smc [Sphingomonas guangdongensis]